MIKITEDKAFAKTMWKAIREKDGHCPCAVEMTEDTICPCKEFREMESGTCGCGLYIKV